MRCPIDKHLLSFSPGAGKSSGLHLSRLSRGIGEVKDVGSGGGGKKVEVVLEPEVGMFSS